MPAATRFPDPRVRAAAAAVCAGITHGIDGGDPAEVIAELVDLEGLTADDLGQASVILVGKIVEDVRRTIGVSPRRTAELLGLWIATDELAGGS